MKQLFAKPYKPSPDDSEALRRLDLLEELEAMGRKRTVKTELMEEEGDLLRSVFLYTYDWRQSFGIRKMPPGKGRKGSVPGAAKRWQEFQNILYALNERVVTGNKAIRTVTRLFKQSSELEVRWYKRILGRDLKIHIGKKTVAKCYPGLIPEWEVQVASSLKEIEDCVHLDYKRGVYADVKIDGIRLTIVVERGQPTVARTRSGHSYVHVTGIIAELERMGPGYYDGEVFADRWNKTSSIFHRDPTKPGAIEAIQQLNFRWFDLYMPDRPDATLVQRRKEMWRRAYKYQTEVGKFGPVGIVPIKKMVNAQAVIAFYMRAINDGHEGLMIKRADGLWSPTDKRDDTWIKVKPFKTVDAVVIDYYEGKDRLKGTFGGFVVEYEDKHVRVGGGYTDKLRDRIWKKAATYIGTTIEFKIQDDRDKVAVGRFVVFQRFREDK